MALLQVRHYVMNLIQVVGQQLNFIEGSLSPVSSHDQESDYTMSGKSYTQKEYSADFSWVLFLTNTTHFGYHLLLFQVKKWVMVQLILVLW